MIIDFDALFTMLVLKGGISQIVLPFDDDTKELKKGDTCEISFGGMKFKNYTLVVCNVSVTSLKKLSFQDIFHQGFLYKPFFLKYMQEKGFDADDTVVKVDFKLKELKL